MQGPGSGVHTAWCTRVHVSSTGSSQDLQSPSDFFWSTGTDSFSCLEACEVQSD